LEEEALKENTEAVFAELPVEIATFLLNEKRHEVNQIEARLGTRIVLIPSPALHGSQSNIQRLRSEDLDANENILASHKIKIVSDSEAKGEYSLSRKKGRAAVNLDQIDTPPPPPSSATKEKPGDGFWTLLWKRLTGDIEKPKPKSTPRKAGQRSRGRSDSRRKPQGRRDERRRDSSRQNRRTGSDGGRNRTQNNRPDSKSRSEAKGDASKAPQRRSRDGRGRSGGQRQGNRQTQPSRPDSDAGGGGGRATTSDSENEKTGTTG